MFPGPHNAVRRNDRLIRMAAAIVWAAFAAGSLILSGCGGDRGSARPHVPVESEGGEGITIDIAPGGRGGGVELFAEAPSMGVLRTLAGGAGSAMDAVQILSLTATPAAADEVVRQLIRNARMTIEVESAEATLARVEDAVTAIGGYVSNQEISERRYGDVTRKRAQVVLRVPAAGTDSMLTVLRGLGDVKSERVWTEDVTEEYYDTQIRLQNAREERDQLADVLRTAGTVEDILNVRRELNRVTEEIERTTGRLRRLSNRISLATITLELAEPVPITQDRSSSVGKVAQAFDEMIDVFWGTIAGMIVLLGALIPLAAVFALIAWIVVKVVRRRRARRQVAASAEAAASEQS